MDMSLAAPPPLVSVAICLFVALVWVGPIGLFVLRKHLANASGPRLLVKTILFGLTALTAPAAALMVLVVLFGFGEAGDLIWSLLKSAW